MTRTIVGIVLLAVVVYVSNAIRRGSLFRLQGFSPEDAEKLAEERRRRRAKIRENRLNTPQRRKP